MKKYLVLFVVLFFAAVSFAKPIGGPPAPSTGLKTYTVATIPSASANLNMAIIITDGNTDIDCETTGGGTTRNVCVSDGTNWIIAGDGAAGSGVSDTAYGDGSTWDAVTTIAPSKNAVRDQLYLYDTDGDGDIDNIDGAVGGGDITGVGPGGTGAGDALTDGYVTQNTTSMFIWEGPTADTVEYNFILPAADPITADTNWTYPADSGTFLVGETAHADNTLLTIDGTGSLTQETGVTIDDAENMAGIGTLGVTGVITSADATEASATTTASVKVAGGLGVVKDIWVGDDIVLDSDSAVISFGADQDINITHTADTGLTVFEGTEEILILKDGGAGSAVNEITILSAATTASPTIQQTGEADIGIDFETVNDEEMLQLDAVAAGTNNLKIANAANAASPSIVAVGSSDANVGILIDAKAAGEIIIGSDDAKFSLVSDALDIDNAGNIANAGTIGSGAITSTSSFTAGAASGLFSVTGNNPITIGHAGATAVTITTDDTGDGTDLVLPAQSVNGSEILNNTVTHTQLAAVITLADGDLINFGGITMSGTNDEGLVLPAWGNTTPTTDQPYLTYDSASNALKVFEGGWVTIGATAAPTDADYLTLSLDGTLSAERVLTESTQGIDFTDAGANTTLTISLDTTEVEATTWGAGGNASNIWTFAVSGTNTTMTHGNATTTFSGQVLAGAGVDLGTSQALTGTTAITVGSGSATTAITSSDWAIGATGIMTGIGNFTSNGTLTVGSGGIAITDATGNMDGTKIADADLGDGTFASGVFTIDANVLDKANMKDEDWGDGSFSSNSFTLDADVVAAAEMADADHGMVSWTSGVATVEDFALSANATVADNITIAFGTGSDWTVGWDQTTDQALEFSTALTAAAAATDPMFLIQVDSGAAGMTADQDVFGIYKGTTKLFDVDEDGDVTILGKLTITGTADDHFMDFTSNTGTPPSAGTNSMYVISNVFKVAEGGTEKDLVLDADSVTWTGATHSFAAVASMVLPTAVADASGEISMSTGNQLKWHDGTKVVTIDTTPTNDNYVLKYDNASATFTLEADETGGTPAWENVTDPTVDVNMIHPINVETQFTYTGDFTTGTQFNIEQLTGNPTGGVLFAVKVADNNVTAARIGDGTNYMQVSQLGAVTFAGTGSGITPVPPSSDGAALGSDALDYSDLWLADGAKIDFDSGDVTITHTAETLTVAGGDLIVTGITTGGSPTPIAGTAAGFAAGFTGANLYGGTYRVTTAGAAALPNAAVGMNFTILHEVAGASTINPDSAATADTIQMNGLIMASDEDITASAVGAMCVFQYQAADVWMATCNDFTEATPP